MRLLASFEGVAPQNDATLEALRQKHPSSPDELDLPAPPNDEYPSHTIASVEDVRKAISSFNKGSAGEKDGLRPSHLKALTSCNAAEAGDRLLASLTEFVNLVLEGGVLEFAREIFYGATLTALVKRRTVESDLLLWGIR